MSLTERRFISGRNCGLIPSSYTDETAGTCALERPCSAEIELQGHTVGVVHEELPQLDHGHVVGGIDKAPRLELSLHHVIVVALEGDMVDHARAAPRLQIKVTAQYAQPVA